MGFVSNSDIKIYYNDGAKSISLPCAFYESRPSFRWTLPVGVKQKSFTLEMRTVSKKKYHDGETYDCAYYHSALENTDVQEYFIPISMTTESIEGVQQYISTWEGLCEIRLTVDGTDGNTYCTHSVSNEDYAFEENSQNKSWNSSNEGFYFLFEKVRNYSVINSDSSSEYFPADVDVVSPYSVHSSAQPYVFQISSSILFDHSVYSREGSFSSGYSSGVETVRFQNKILGENLHEESIDSLFSGITYYYRTGCEIVSDNSSSWIWSEVKSVERRVASKPECTIISVSNPEEGSEYFDRKNGEISIRIRISDADSDRLSVVFCWSSKSLTVDGFLEAIDSKDSQISNLLHRVVTYENTLSIPVTSMSVAEGILFNWASGLDSDLSGNKFNAGDVVLWAYAYDGEVYSNVSSYSNFELDNSYSEGSGSVSTMTTMWCNGLISRNLVYPMIPELSCRQLVVFPQIVLDDNGKEIKKINASMKCWLDFFQSYESGKGYSGSNRVTQSGNLSVKNWDKYPERGWSYKKNDNGEYYLDGDYSGESVSINANGFVMFCQDCSSLEVLKTVVILEDGSVIDEYPAGYEYDGSRLSLAFRCAKCGRIYPAGIKFFEDFAYNTHGRVVMDTMSYWRGYSSDESKNTRLSHEMSIVSRREYESIVSAWKEEHGENSNYPYSFGEIPGSDESSVDSSYGMLPFDKLVGISERHDFSPYSIVKSPDTMPYLYGVYNDGSKLNACIDKDYMHGYKKVEASENLAGEVDPGTPGDPNLEKLANQKPWEIQDKIPYIYCEGKSVNNSENGYDSSNGVGTGGSSGGNSSSEIVVRFDASDKSVCHYEFDAIDGSKKTAVIKRMAVFGKILFPLSIDESNCMYSVVLNGKTNYSGSVLLSDNSISVHENPYSYVSDYDGGHVSVRNSSDASKIDSVLRALFSSAFDFSEGYSSYIAEVEENSISFCLYGKASARIMSFSVLGCANSIYGLIGVYAGFNAIQNAMVFPGKLGDYVKYGVLNKSESGEQYDDRRYYYTERELTSHSYFAEESPIDNKIEEFESVENDYETESIKEYYSTNSSRMSRKLSVSSSGEPMFTCYKDEVDENGYHFKYTEEDFRKTGRIYVRRYHIEPCNHYEMRGFGYRDWSVDPIEGKPGRYRKTRRIRCRGAVPVFGNEIHVELEDGSVVMEHAWFPPFYDETTEPISHERKQEENEEDEEKEYVPVSDAIYVRKSDYSWTEEFMAKTCVVFDYVDIEEVLAKNVFDAQCGIPPLNHRNPICVKGGTFADLVKRYGIYVMGGYDLTDDQKSIFNDGESYSKEFIDENGKKTYSILPNNWRKEFMSGNFDSVKEESSSFNAIRIYKNDSGDTERKEKSIKSYSRYESYWSGKIDPPEEEGYVLSQTTVEQFNPGINGRVGIIRKIGLQSSRAIGNYWILSSDENKYLQMSSNVVHAITGDPFLDSRIVGDLFVETILVSDRTQNKFNRQRYLYDIQKYLDYRLCGEIKNDVRYYYSAYPRIEHGSYSNRPASVYDYDRPWRIGGFRRRWNSSYLGEDLTQNEYYDEERNDLTDDSPGAQIQYYSNYQNSYFMYLQDEWNSYNLIHWHSIKSDSYFCLFYQREIKENDFSSMTPLKTVGSVWLEGAFGIGAWGMKHDDEEQSAEVDTIDSQMEYGNRYRFVLYSYDAITGQASSHLAYSKTFTVSESSVSPATIIGTEYDPWAQTISISFRFDDWTGRAYDVVGVYYSNSDPENGASGNESWTEIKLGNISGKLNNLSSNVRSGGIYIPDEKCIRHKITMNLSALGDIVSSDTLRIKIESDISLNRLGLTKPSFSVKMWANEFLKEIEEDIQSLAGNRNQWVWKETINEDGTTTGTWNFVSKENAVVVMGRIQEYQEKINDMEEECTKSICSSLDFRFPDLECHEGYLRSYSSSSNYNKFEELYYGDSAFELYLDSDFSTSDSRDEYQSFRESYAGYSAIAVKRGFLSKYGYKNGYKYFYNANRRMLLKESYDSMTSSEKSEFFSWQSTYHSSSPYSSARISYAKSMREKYLEFYSIPEEDYNEDAITDELALRFILESNLIDSFIGYYSLFKSSQKKYNDTRFEEMAVLMNNKFGVMTRGFYDTSSEISAVFPEGSYYGLWLSSIGMSYSSLSLSDIYRAFLDYVSENPSYANMESFDYSVPNYGHANARISFMQSYSSGSLLTNGQRYQSLNSEISKMYSRLYDDYEKKNELETEFRRRVVRDGFFSNGFVENNPYDGEDINTCFRFRVETRRYEGKYNPSQIEDDDDIGTDISGNVLSGYSGYDDRYNMYLRFQMDFSEEFDSQDGIPLIDKCFVDSCLSNIDDSYRIQMGIDETNNEAKSSPTAMTNVIKTVDIPEVSDSLVDTENASYSYSSNDPTAMQMTASFSLDKSELPDSSFRSFVEKPYAGDYDRKSACVKNPFVPYPWGNSSYQSYRNAYYWRVAPYNILERPVFEMCMASSVVEPQTQYGRRSAIFLNRYCSNSVLGGKLGSVYAANGLLSRQKWCLNSESIAFSMEMSPYDNEWVNGDFIQKGGVDFVTDRPRKMVSIEIQPSSSSSSSVDSSSSQESVVPDSITVRNNEEMFPFACGIYVKQSSLYNNAPQWKYTNGTDYLIRFDGYEWEIYDVDDYNTLGNANGTASSNPCDLSWNWNFILTSSESESTDEIQFQGDSSSVEVDSSFCAPEYIEDNIGNYDTQWLPHGTDRKKPCVVLDNNLKYHLFSHKLLSKESINGVSYDKNVITESIGMANNVFGELGMCFPRYSYENPSDVIDDALSFENPFVFRNGSLWTMYFNVLKHNGSGFFMELWRANSSDLDFWSDFSKISVVDEEEVSNVLDPFVVRNSFEESVSYDLYAVRKKSSYFSLFKYTSVDGMNFVKSFEITSPEYGINADASSPSVVLNEDNTRDIYFGLLSSINGSKTGIVVSCVEINGEVADDNEEDTPFVIQLGSVGSLFSHYDGALSQSGGIACFADSYFFNPSIIEDYDCGTSARRMYYNSNFSPYLWKDGKIVIASYLSEESIFTRYLEKYSWRYAHFNQIKFRKSGESDWTDVYYNDFRGTWSYGGNEKYLYHPACKDGYEIMVDFDSNDENCYAVKWVTGAKESSIRTYARGEWIGFDNVNDTEATLRPESIGDADYDVKDYTFLKYVMENNLLDSYGEWISDLSDSSVSDELKARSFIIERNLYGDYMMWSRKGSGIYRYVGWNAIKTML